MMMKFTNHIHFLLLYGRRIEKSWSTAVELLSWCGGYLFCCSSNVRYSAQLLYLYYLFCIEKILVYCLSPG